MPIDHATVDKLEALRRRYAQQLRSKIAAIESTWDQFESDPKDRASLEVFHRMVHGLAGSGATFGFPAISESAHSLEALASTILDAGVGPTAKLGSQIRRLLEELRGGYATAGRMALVGIASNAARDESTRGQKPVFIIDGDGDQAQVLAAGIEKFGYDVRVFDDAEAMIAAIAQTPPAAILLGVVFDEGREFGIRLATRIRETQAIRIPILFMSAKQDFERKLAAARAGGDAFLAKPLRADKVVEKLDLLVGQCALGPYRVMIVGNDKATATEPAMWLQGADMIVEVVNDPALACERLDWFDAEVILIDFELPQCSGLELAKVIRQHEAHARRPVVMVTRDADIGDQLLRLGLDETDVLAGPLEPTQLLTRVSYRIRQARSAAANRNRDRLGAVLQTTVGTVHDHTATTPEARSLAAGRPAERTTLSKFLIVGEDPYILEAIRIQLEATGAHVLQAMGGTEGFALAYRERPDIIIADYGVSTGSGGHLLDRLNQTTDTRHIPVVVVTDQSNSDQRGETVQRALMRQHGAVACIAKPLRLDALQDVVRRYVPG